MNLLVEGVYNSVDLQNLKLGTDNSSMKNIISQSIKAYV